jgi:glycosyltransferase involved in cell wall biosynthesis
MDATVAAYKQLKVLLEMRPALDRHAGIPQQTRLLFRALALREDLAVAGLIQSSSNALGSGLPAESAGGSGLSMDEQINRLSRIVIMLDQGFLRSRVSALLLAGRRLVGRSEELTRFEPRHFRDFIWRRMFAKSLPPADFELVTGAGFRIARAPWTAFHICTLASGGLLIPRLDTSEFDVMIAETPYPAKVSKRTKLVIRYHDAVPLLMPHTIADRRYDQAFHYRALRHNVANGAWFVCVSEATRRDLLAVFPQVESRAVTIHNMVSHEYFDEPSAPARVAEIIGRRRNPRVLRLEKGSRDVALADDSRGGAIDYLLMVSTVEPRKNHLALLAAWERLRSEGHSGLKLILVGSLGWHHAEIVRKYRPWVRRGDAFVLDDVPSSELRLLYKHARVAVCPSFAEGFGLSGVEAMMCGCPVVASDIAAHREVYADAAEYCNPYSLDDLVRAIRGVIDPANARRREELVALGAAVARRYTCEAIQPKWRAFLAAACAPHAAVSEKMPAALGI